MTYSEKLKDPRWQRKRLEIFQRDNFTCAHCQETESELHLHHRYYRFNLEPWGYPNNALVTLCIHCHTGATAIRKLFKIQSATIPCRKQMTHLYKQLIGVYNWSLAKDYDPNEVFFYIIQGMRRGAFEETKRIFFRPKIEPEYHI